MSLIGLKCNETSLSLFYIIVSITSIKLYKYKIANIIKLSPYTPRQRYINEDKIVPNTDKFMIFAI